MTLKYIKSNNEIVQHDASWTNKLLDQEYGKGKWKVLPNPPSNMDYPEWDGNEWINNDPRTYIEKRRAAYPPIGDQLDLIYHDKKQGTNKWESTIDKIKQDYPKQ